MVTTVRNSVENNCFTGVYVILDSMYLNFFFKKNLTLKEFLSLSCWLDVNSLEEYMKFLKKLISKYCSTKCRVFHKLYFSHINKHETCFRKPNK